VALLETLADVFASMLDNVRLQHRRQEQELRSQELALSASRSELKALRAQINPHFLFNALNAIAGLIHKDPRRADQAVEQLAEVFRYTLRGSESEWVALEDELDFVRSYLEVEQARFGARLAFRIELDPALGPLRIPTMILQTLVENAVKHGVAVSRGPGRIEVTADRRADRLVLEVTDNGPGLAHAAEGSTPEGRGGFGLSNVRRRLQGYFGAAAELAVQGDAARGLTVASVRLPLDRLGGAAGVSAP
jgi:sensor histidine kinase YesM